MEDTLIEFKTAKLAKKKGFKFTQRIITSSPNPKKSNGSFTDQHGISQSLLQKWLREVYNIHITGYPIYNKEGTEVEHYEFMVFTNNKSKTNASLDRLNGSYDKYKTYEQALEEGLQQALNSIK